jgi:hypothetical protein
MISFKSLVVAALLLVAPVAYADDVDLAALSAPIKGLAAAINHDAKAAPKQVFTRDAVVFDDFAPYRWSGKSNARAWYGDLVGTSPETQAAYTAMKAKLTIEAAKFARVTGDAAYLVVPAQFDFIEDGKHLHQTAQWIFTEQKVDGVWLISGHAYAIVTETEVPEK